MFNFEVAKERIESLHKAGKEDEIKIILNFLASTVSVGKFQEFVKSIQFK